MIHLISKAGQLAQSLTAEQLASLAGAQPVIDSSKWGRTPYIRRLKFQLVKGETGTSVRLPDRRELAALKAAKQPETRRIYMLSLDEGTNLDELLPVSGAITLDLMESFGVRVSSFRHVGTERSQAILTLHASAEQVALILEAYPNAGIVEAPEQDSA